MHFCFVSEIFFYQRSQEANKVLWKEREILVLSDQRLTELKDKITCASDVAWVSSDISENPDVELKERAGDAYPSNFFFIENTFYPDLRNPLATDISKYLDAFSIRTTALTIPTNQLTHTVTTPFSTVYILSLNISS